MTTVLEKQKQAGIRHGRWLFALSLFFLAAPLWAPYAQELKGKNLFLSADAMVLLGAALLTGLFCGRVLPDIFLRAADKTLEFIRSKYIVLSCVLLPVILFAIYFINQNILHSFMNSADEHSCYFLAECFRMGKWWVEPHSLSEFFDVVHVGNRDGKWFSVYPPGWPALWALGIEWNTVDWLNPVMTTLSLVFFFKAGQKIYGRLASWVGLALMAVTPFFMFTAASYFSHGTTLLMISIFLYSFLNWQDAKTESRAMLWAGIAALALGYGLATRYLTTAALAGPFLLYHFGRVLLRREKWKKSDTLFAVIVALFVGLVLYQNYEVTGKPFRAPNKHDKSWERLGFRDFYTPVDGGVYILARFFYLLDWFPPALIALFLVFSFRKRPFEGYKTIFQYGFFYLVFAYFLYFSWGGNQYGPRYYYEGLPFLALALGSGLKEGWLRGNSQVKKFLLGVVLVSIVTGGYQFYKHGTFFDEASSQRKALYDYAEETIDQPSVVFIRGFLGQALVMSQDDAVRNSPSLDAKILYARDKGGDQNQPLIDYYPNRDHYIGWFDREAKVARLEKLG